MLMVKKYLVPKMWGSPKARPNPMEAVISDDEMSRKMCFLIEVSAFLALDYPYSKMMKPMWKNMMLTATKIFC